MTTEQYSIGYDEGFQNGWNAAVDAKPEQPAQQEPVAWMHEWEDGERIPMLTGRDDRNTDEPISVRPLVYADTSPPAQRKQVGDSRFESWYSEDFDPKGKGTKQQMREAYEAGMNDPSPPAQQEPVAWIYSHGKAKVASVNYVPGVRATPLYTSPPAQRAWVGLSEEDREQHRNDWYSNIHDKEFRAIEAKLRSKNEDRN